MQAGRLGNLLRLADLPLPHLGLEQLDRLRQRYGLLVLGIENAAAKCSISTPTNRSMLPNGARWIITGRCARLSAPMYSSWNRSGRL